MNRSALGADPLPDMDILDRLVDIATLVACLAGGEEPIDQHDFLTVLGRDVFQLLQERIESVLGNLPPKSAPSVLLPFLPPPLRHSLKSVVQDAEAVDLIVNLTVLRLGIHLVLIRLHFRKKRYGG